MGASTHHNAVRSGIIQHEFGFLGRVDIAIGDHWDSDVHATVIQHLTGLYELYGATSGVRIARKHIRWYLSQLPILPQSPISDHPMDVGKKSQLCIPKILFRVDSPEQQLSIIDSVFDQYGIAT